MRGRAHENPFVLSVARRSRAKSKGVEGRKLAAISTGMIVGVLKIALILPENHSLKGKRSVLRKIQSRVSNRFNISTTECGDQDLWQRALLGFGVVGSNARIVEATLRQVVEFVDRLGLAELGESDIRILHE